MAVVLIGTMDTKGHEYAFVRDLLAKNGLSTQVIDTGIVGEQQLNPDLSREDFYRLANVKVSDLIAVNDRGAAIAAAVKAAQAWAKSAQGVDGIIALGGSAGTTIGTAAMRALPYGVPKVMVSTLASGQVKSFVGIRDIAMFHSVADIAGLNRLTRQVLTNAAGAMVGMVQAKAVAIESDLRPVIAATMFGVTTPCVSLARTQLEALGNEVMVFHATGTGGMTMEAMIKEGLIAAVLDITTTELADELVGGILSAGPDRLTAAALKGIPQVISVGALDMVNFGPRESVPKKFEGRTFYQHNENVTLMRTTPEENDRLGLELAQKACAAQGPTAILFPLRGVSAIDREGGPFWNPEADRTLLQSIRNWLMPGIELIEIDSHINDPEFAQAAVAALGKLQAKAKR